MKKEKIITIREESDFIKLLDDIKDLIEGYNLTYVEILGIIRLLEEDIIEEMRYVQDED